MSQERSTTRWHVVGVFLAATFFHSLWLAGLHMWLGLSLRYFLLPQGGPVLGLLTTWWFYRGRFGDFFVTRSAGRLAWWRRVGLVMAVCAVYLVLAWVLREMLVAQTREFSGLLGLFLISQLLGSLTEEVGWRGFLQPLLVQRWGALAGASLTGIIWACWHGNKLTDPGMFVIFALTCVALSLAIQWLALGSWWQRTLISAWLHALVNITPALLLDFGHAHGAGAAPTIIAMAPQVLLGLVAIVALQWRKVAGKD